MEISPRKRLFSFKGRGQSILVSFESTTLPGITDILNELRDAGSLISGHQLILDFKSLKLSRNWVLDFMRDVVFPMGISVSMWASEEPSTLDVFASFGFKLDGEERPVVTQGSLKIVSSPLRSGQTLRHDGDVLMLCNLHSGAEIQATGSIIVLGTLLGQVHAGCNGASDASVVTLNYQTNQLRIGSMMSNAVEPGTSPWWGKAVRIFIEGGVFVVSEIGNSKEK